MTPTILPFWRAMLADPRRIGAIAPASRSLCDAIIDEVMSSRPGHVIELGAGTGAITRALFGQRAQFDSLAAVERSPHLAQLLAHRFPGLAVHPVCASRLDTLLKGPLDTISVVSSLPFRSLPQGDRKQIEQAILRLSRHSRTFRFIQYSYLGRLPFPVDSTHPLQWTRRRTVLGNLPPATVWVLAPHHR